MLGNVEDLVGACSRHAKHPPPLSGKGDALAGGFAVRRGLPVRPITRRYADADTQRISRSGCIPR
jgi:hypothetical protein